MCSLLADHYCAYVVVQAAGIVVLRLSRNDSSDDFEVFFPFVRVGDTKKWAVVCSRDRCTRSDVCLPLLYHGGPLPSSSTVQVGSWVLADVCRGLACVGCRDPCQGAVLGRQCVEWNRTGVFDHVTQPAVRVLGCGVPGTPLEALSALGTSILRAEAGVCACAADHWTCRPINWSARCRCCCRR